MCKVQISFQSNDLHKCNSIFGWCADSIRCHFSALKDQNIKPKFNNDPSAGSPTDTVLRLSHSSDDVVYKTSLLCNVSIHNKSD